MIELSKLLDLLSTKKSKYNKFNVKLKVKKDGKFESGRDKLKITISDNKDKVIYESFGCETDKKVLLVDDKALYNVAYQIEE